jgi:DNA-binding GntR family transcriptional regulator
MDDAQETRRARGSGSRLAYDTIRDEILTLDLEPGQLKDETSLAERLGMSRSPIREALIRLAGEGLVVMLPNRSSIVAPIDVQSFPKYVEALDLVQRMVTRLAAMQRSEADLKTIAARQKDFVAAVRSGNHLAMSEADKRFHMAIAAAGKNPYFAAFCDRLLDQGRRMLHLHFDCLERTRDGRLLANEHDEMLAAIRARDIERSDRLAHEHTRQFRDTFLACLTENRTQSVSLCGTGTGGQVRASDRAAALARRQGGGHCPGVRPV